MREESMARAVLLCVVWIMVWGCARGDFSVSIKDFGNQMFNVGVDDAVNDVPGLTWNEDECLRPPCGDGWKGEPTAAIDCPAPHTSPVWFSGSFDFMGLLGDLFFAGLAAGRPSLKKSKSVSTGVTKVSKIAKVGKGAGYLGAALFVGYSVYNNIEHAEYFCSPCLWNEYSKVYWEGDSAQQELCQNDPLDDQCVQLIQPWQEEEGRQICTLCPPYTVPNSILAPTYPWKRCYEDCSAAYAVMGPDYDQQRNDEVLEQLKSMGFKAYNEEALLSKWASSQAFSEMRVTMYEGRNPEQNHFVPVRKDGETTCQPCADGQTKFAFRWADYEDHVTHAHQHEHTVGIPNFVTYTIVHTHEHTHYSQILERAERAHFHDFPIKFECRACPSGMVQYFDREEFGSDGTKYDVFDLGFRHADFRCAVCPPEQGVVSWSGSAVRVEGGPGGCQPCSALSSSLGYQKLGRNEIQLPITEYNTEVERVLLMPKECASCPLGFDRQLADFGLAAPEECREALRWPDVDGVVPQYPWNFHSAVNTPAIVEGGDVNEAEGVTLAKRVRNGCCSACGVNQKRGSGDTVGCVAIEPREGTPAVYGNTAGLRCGEGQDLIYCPLFYTSERRCVRNQIADLNSHWRTCRQCSRTMRVVRRTEAGVQRFRCEECIGSVANLARAEGEFRSSADLSTCESCSGCSYLQVTRGLEDVAVPLTPEGNSEDAVEKYLSEQHTRGFSGGFGRPKLEYPNQDLRQVPFQTQTVQVQCVPLPRRELGVTVVDGVQEVQVFGDDYYKVRKTAADEPDPFAAVYELFKRVLVPVGFAVRYRQNLDCSLLSCADACDAPFHYADRCGPRPAHGVNGVNDVYVEGDRFVLKLEDAVNRDYLRVTNMHAWQIRHEGYCRPCQSCEDGQFTQGCNDLASEFPGGTCASCEPQVSCEDDQYKWHKLGPEGCTARYERGIRVSARPQSPYVCRPCPRWIRTDGTENERNEQELRIVASCGQARPYVYWTVLNGEYVVDSAAEGAASEYVIGETLPFCPPGHFYDANKAGCGLNRDLSEFAQANDLDQGFDELTQQRLDSCCVRCEVCEVDITRKGPDYVECSGATLRDTQGEQCMRKCPFGTHDDNQTCVRCQECFVGESLSRD